MNRLVIFILLIFSMPIYGKDNIVLHVKDECSHSLTYGDVFVKNEWHFITDSTGKVSIKEQICHVGDTIKITYLGYEDRIIPITEKFRTLADTVIQLTPKSYSLNDITIKSKHKFNAEKFFKSKKRFLLLPYDDKRIVSVYAKVNYIDEKGKPKVLCDSMQILFESIKGTFLKCGIQDTVIRSRIIRYMLYASNSAPYACCLKRLRKLFKINYWGKTDSTWNFRFDILPENVSSTSINGHLGDDIQIVVAIDKKGFIPTIQLHTILKFNPSRSYNMFAIYDDYKNEMVPEYVNATSIADKMNIELWCKYGK
jgi:hypothetical protein